MEKDTFLILNLPAALQKLLNRGQVVEERWPREAAEAQSCQKLILTLSTTPGFRGLSVWQELCPSGLYSPPSSSHTLQQYMDMLAVINEGGGDREAEWT